MKSLFVLVFVSTAMFLSFYQSTSYAQAFSRLEPGQQTVTVETGLQSAVVTSVGYAAGLRVPAIHRTVMPFLQATLLPAHADLGDYGARGGGQVSLVDLGWLDVSTQLAVEVEGTDNTIHRATALRSDLILLIGHYGSSWFVAGEGGFDRSWLTYIKNSDWYRTNVYAAAKDGWYEGTAGTLHGGAKAGFRLASVEVVARAGVNKTETLADLNLPFYAMVGANYRF